MRGFGGKDFLISAFHWSIFLGFGALRFDSEIMMQAASFTSVLLPTSQVSSFMCIFGQNLYVSCAVVTRQV